MQGLRLEFAFASVNTLLWPLDSGTRFEPFASTPIQTSS